ncbi:MAG: PAS domain S-box protein, partial [Candidatus Electrothrix sp. AR3]|nr:PAS domain S-box protein [Candidatus Electrothrix sp. AR3]
MSDQVLNLLLIEDNPDHADLFLANLSITAYADARIVHHETLQGGYDCLLAESFDLLFIDLSLKDSSIFQTLERLPELGMRCPTIVLTSLDDKRTILDIISRGADDCLPKSELNDVLLERIIHFNLDRWQLKQQLIKNEEAYRDLYHNSPNMLVSVDANTGKVLTCNQTLIHNLNYSMEEIIGQEVFMLYHPDCLPVAKKFFALFGRTGRVTNAELQLMRKDGGKLEVLLNASAVRDKNGKILHSRSTWIDITEKKAAEKKLQYMQQLNRLIIETIPDLLWLKDVDGVYLTCNPRFEQFFGAKENEIVGKTDYDFLDQEVADICREHDLKSIETGQTLMEEEWVTFACNGEKILLETTKTPLLYNEGRAAGMLGIGHDITDRHEAAEKAEAASRAKSVFLSNMSHELRTPLNAILGYTQILGKDKTLNDKQRNGIKTIHRAGEHLLLLINDVLDISKIESGRLELICTEFRLSSFLDGIRDIIQLRVQEKGIKFLYSSNELVPYVIIADELRLRQVLLNLLSNAVKFTQYGHCSLHIRTEATGKKNTARLTVMVEDSGTGIAKKDQQLVFDPFPLPGG